MQKKISIRLIKIIAILLVGLLLGGCGMPPSLRDAKPIEPIVPGSDGGNTLAHFSVQSAGLQIRNLSVTDDGSLTLVGTASSVIYLLEHDGKLRWERALQSEPLQTYLDSEGRFLVVGTAGGKFLALEPDQSLLFEFQAYDPVGIISASKDGELFLAGLTPADSEKPDKLVLLNKWGELLWEETFEQILDARIVGPQNRVIVNWSADDEPSISAFSAEGEKRWELQQRTLMALDSSGKMLLNTLGSEVLRYDDAAAELWGYTVSGKIAQVILAEDGEYFGVRVTDEATQSQDLHYFNKMGQRLWEKRVPADSEILVSADGLRLIVASWRQYRDDATQIYIYNQHGQQTGILEVAGRTQKMALANDAGILVLALEDGGIYFLNILEDMVTQEDTVVIDEQSLTQFYQPVVFGREEGESRLLLFFYDEVGQNLVPVTRRIKRTSTPTATSINELVRGPVQGSQLHRTIPKDAEIDVSYSEHVVTVNFPKALDEMGGTTFITGVVNSVMLTISQFPNVEYIQFTIDGEKVATFGQDGLVIEGQHEPTHFGRKPGERLVFIPGRSGTRYYLLAESEHFIALKEKALIETLVRHVLKKSQLSALKSLELLAVRIENNVVYLDFSETLNRIIADNVETAAQAAMLRDALTLTISENAYYSNIHITINGNPPKQPKGYLPWELSISRPYHINMED